jgi:8-oxo-dGTP pyrophosphatase MutT (NUDIX family)
MVPDHVPSPLQARHPGLDPRHRPPEGCGHECPGSGSNVGQVPSERQQPDIRTLESHVVYQDSWLRLRQDKIERRDGSRGTYAVVEKPDFALVVPAEDGGFHLVEEYRYPIERRSWSFPQGGWPVGTTGDAADLARLELSQETGLRARELTRLGFLHGSHGTTAQGFHIFLATGLEPGAPDREAEEQDMRQQWVPRAQFEDMVRGGVITDDSTLAAYALLLLHEKRSR